MTEPASKIFTTYSTILYLTKEEILQVGYNTNDARPIPSFDQELLTTLCLQAQTIFSKEDIILDLDGDVIVAGDIHGSLHDLLRIINFNNVNHNKIVFLGDFVDRGNFSLECITLLFALKVLFPKNYYLIRGNHEFDSICSQYGFKEEIVENCIHKENSLPRFPNFSIYKEDSKKIQSDLKLQVFREDELRIFNSNYKNYQYDESLYNAFIKAFSYLPICAIINKTSICIHGGISPHLKFIDDIRNSIKRPVDHFDENELLCDLLWSDPSKRCAAISQPFDQNPRGRGKLFSEVSISNFLNNNSLIRLIRGHECVKNGIDKKFNDKCITVFSASSYDKDMGNKCSILKVIQNGDQIETITFSPIVKLDRFRANFFNVQPIFDKGISAKPFFTMTTNVKVQPLLDRTKSDEFFKINNDNELNETTRQKIPQASSTKVKINNPCPAINGNRTKPRLVHSHVRNVSNSFAFNTGIRNKRKNSNGVLNQMPNSLKPLPNADNQSDDLALIEVENMGKVEDDKKSQLKLPKQLPKLISKSQT